MKKQVQRIYNNITMSDECTQRIEAALSGKYEQELTVSRGGESLSGRENSQTQTITTKLYRFLPKQAAVAVAAVIALLLVGEGTVYACTGSGIISHIFSFAQNAVFTRTVTEDGASRVSVSYDTSTATAPAIYQDGKLLFTANGESINITNSVSDTASYLYTYTDETGVTHYMIVGGRPETFGYAEFLKDAQGNWVGGYYQGGVVGESIDPQWLLNAKKAMDIPW